MTAAVSLPQNVSLAGGWPHQTVLEAEGLGVLRARSRHTLGVSGQEEGPRHWGGGGTGWGGCLLLYERSGTT